MKNFALKKIGILTFGVISMVSCSDAFDTSFFEKDIVDSELQVELPVGYISYTAQELFEELSEDLDVGSTTDGQNSLVSFTYTESIDGGSNSDFVEFENQSLEEVFFLLLEANPLLSSLPDGTSYTYGSNPAADFQLGTSSQKSLVKDQPINDAEGNPLDEELTSANFSNGTLKIVFEPIQLDAQTEIIFKIPSLINKASSQVYETTFILNNKSGADVISNQINLSEYLFDATQSAETPNNTVINNVAVELDATITFNNGDELSATDNIKYIISLENVTIDNAAGDFKNQSFEVNNESFNIDFFDELGDGDISFENPILRINASNEYGFPIGIKLDDISTNASENNQLTIIDDGNSTDNIDLIDSVNYALMAAGTSSDNGVTSSATETSIVLNNTNSNLADLLAEKPTLFNLNVSGISNPGSVSGNNNFFNANNNLNVDIEVEIPLYATLDGVGFSEEVDFDDTEDIQDAANSVLLDVRTQNSMPLAGSIVLEFMDDSNNVLITKNIDAFDACPVDNDGYSTGSIDSDGNVTGTIASSTSELSFNESEIETLADVTKINITVEFNSYDGDDADTDPDPVKLRTDDTVRLSLGLKGDIKIGDNE